MVQARLNGTLRSYSVGCDAFEIDAANLRHLLGSLGKARPGLTSETFKDLGKLAFLRKGMPLPIGATREFNEDPANVLQCRRAVDETDLATWFDLPGKVTLDEEIIGLGRYGYTLTVLTSEALPEDPFDEEDEDAELEKSWTPRFAYRR